MINNEKKINNGMIEWRDENNAMEDYEKMVKIWVIKKLCNDERLFE